MILVSLFCASLTLKEKTKYYANLNMNDVRDTKKFWITTKSCFSDKSKTSEQKVQIENYKMVTKEHNVAHTLNVSFSDVVTTLNILKFKNCNLLSKKMPQPILSAILKYVNHPSINAIIKIQQKRSIIFLYFCRKGIYN